MDKRDSAQGVQSSEDTLLGSSPLVLGPQPSWNAGPSSNPLPGGPVPTLTEVNPELGPITGGERIWIKGMDFPALFPLFARFGTCVVPTVSSTGLRFGPHFQSKFF